MEPWQNTYISVFKIDNVPIIPPLMTAEKYEEMRRYKDLAAMLEVKLKFKADAERNELPIKQPEKELKWEKPGTEECPQLTNLLEGKSEDDVQVLFKKENGINQNRLSKSDTFIYDIITNTVIMPYDNYDKFNYCKNPYDNYSTDLRTTEKQMHQSEIDNSITPNQNKPKVTEGKLFSSASAKLEWWANRSPRKELSPWKQFSNSQVPQISVNPPTPEYKITSRESLNKTLTSSSRESADRRSEAKSSSSRESRRRTSDSRHSSCKEDVNIIPKRSTTSPSIASGEFAPRLIRSNSFTLESPSNALLRHLARQGSNSFDSEIKSIPQENSSEIMSPSEDSERSRTKIESKTTSPKLKDESSPPKQNRKINTLLITNSTMYKNKKSPYDVKLCGRTKILKKHKNPIVRTISAISIKHRSRHSNKKIEEKNLGKITTPDGMNINDMFKGMDEVQKQRLLDLIWKQEEEQKRMREMFEKQQKLLLQELSNSATSDFDCSEEPCSKSVESTNLKPLESPSKPSLEQKQEHLLSAKNSKTIPYRKIVVTVQNSKEYSRPSPRKKLFPDDHQSNKCRDGPITLARKREKAATTLQAYVRGFLVRRLFRTKHVQKLVQIIQDTLLFVLKLHIETRYDNSENNIRLKARLLRQLSSSSQALHNIFSEMPTKERMQIIRKDRLFLANDSARSPRK